MNKFRKKPVVITAITFDQLVAHGLKQAKAVSNGLPWAFEYGGHPITHESDDCYLIPTLEGTMKMGRDDMLITGVKGEIYPCKRDIFAATYDAVPAAPDADLPPHQQRVLDEKQDLDLRITKLDEFIQRNQLFQGLPISERDRLENQLYLMRDLSEILGERIANF